MPLFDPDNTTSAEASALYALADLLSECTAAQALAEETGGTAEANATATRAKVILGPHAGPWDGEQFTPTELAARFIEFQLTSPLDGGRTVVKSDGSFDRADEQGEFLLLIRRHARDSEMADPSDLYLWFLDQIATLEQQLLTNAETRECPRLLAVTRTQGPAFPHRQEGSTQGEYIFTQHTIAWGDPIGGAGGGD